jgi:hypothetical protein
LVAGARRVIIAMEHTTREGQPKMLKKCTLPLTGVKVVDTIVTEMAYMRVTPRGLVLEEIAPGLTAEDVQRSTDARLIVSPPSSQGLRQAMILFCHPERVRRVGRAEGPLPCESLNLGMREFSRNIQLAVCDGLSL